MAKYWVYLNNEVEGPYSVEQLIRIRGFSRQTMVCVDDSSGHPGQWISPADIPELAHIFKVVDQIHESPTPTPPPKAAPKPPPARPVLRSIPSASATPVKPTSSAGRLLWSVVFTILVIGGLTFWYSLQQQGARLREQQSAQSLVEQAPLPARSAYATLNHYWNEKQIKPRWDFERTSSGLYHVTASWYGAAGGSARLAAVYAFEVNLDAQTVRGLNTAAVKLLAEGFPNPQAAAPKQLPPPAKTPAQLFAGAIVRYVDAYEKGDFSGIWQMFSPRKKAEMIRAGISETGFVRLQSLTHGLEAGIEQKLLKTKDDGDNHMLVLLRQTQPNHPDIFIKQLWVMEDHSWKLDDEQKKSAPQPVSNGGGAVGAGENVPQAPPPEAAAKPKQDVMSLPGISH